LGVIIAAFHGSLYNLIRGGGGGRWLFSLLISLLGFWSGQWLSAARGWHFIPMGPLDLGFATLGSYAFLVLGDRLARPQRNRDRAV
jgi:hypothetical protein